MTQNDKFNIQRRTAWRNFWQRLSGVPDLAVKLLFVALYLAGMVWVWSKQEAVSAYAPVSYTHLLLGQTSVLAVICDIVPDFNKFLRVIKFGIAVLCHGPHLY